MKTIHKEYGCTGVISDKRDGSARLVIKMWNGQKVHDKIHKNRKAALSAWYRFNN